MISRSNQASLKSFDQLKWRKLVLNLELLGYLPEIKQQIADMVINDRGTHDTARVLKISRTTVTETSPLPTSL
ncbi:IS1-like element transposase [Leptolyngbyaceae cyanobacterium UHCC 1019]